MNSCDSIISSHLCRAGTCHHLYLYCYISFSFAFWFLSDPHIHLYFLYFLRQYFAHFLSIPSRTFLIVRAYFFISPFCSNVTFIPKTIFSRTLTIIYPSFLPSFAPCLSIYLASMSNIYMMLRSHMDMHRQLLMRKEDQISRHKRGEGLALGLHTPYPIGIHTHTCTDTHAHIDKHTHSHRHTYAHLHTCTHTRAHTHTQMIM